MKYSQEFVWKAVYEFVPSFKTVRENDVSLNLPSCIKLAAENAFVEIGNNSIASLGLDKARAALVLQTALKEMNTVGWMTFGDVEDWQCGDGRQKLKSKYYVYNKA